jgi:soluble lytic murein transglycosylase
MIHGTVPDTMAGSGAPQPRGRRFLAPRPAVSPAGARRAEGFPRGAQGAPIQAAPHQASIAGLLLAGCLTISSCLTVPFAAWAEDARPQTANAVATGAPADAPTGALNHGSPDKPAPDTQQRALSGKPAAEREAAYYARLDEIIAPVKTYELSEADASHVGAAVKALYSGKPEEGAAQAAQVTDPLAKKLVTWYRLRQGYGDVAEIKAFLDQNADWPSRDILQRRLEEALLATGGSTDDIAAYFKDGQPQSGAGLALLASVHLAHGETDKARELAAKVWREYDLQPNIERGFLARFGSLLTEADHKWRLDRLLVEDIRYQSGRNDRALLVKRMIPLLSKPEQAKAEARLAVFMRAKGAKAKLKSAAAAHGAHKGSDKGSGKSTDKAAAQTAQKDQDKDWGLVFHKIQELRRAKKLDEAAKLVQGAPTDPAIVVNLDEWWVERQSLAYQALKASKAKLAYDLVQNAGPLDANALNEQQFMAGWIALRYLKNYAAAEKHLSAYTRTADGPLSRSKAHYWLARALEAKGDKAKATEEYKRAASEIDTFHALLAMQKLEPGRRTLRIEPPADPTPQEIARFRSLEVVRVVALAKAAKLTSIPRIFAQHLAKLDESEGWTAMTAHLAQATGDTQASVRIAKAAIAGGHNLLYYSYPVHALPKYNPLRPPPETAMLLGLARQETEFDTTIVSGAGAQGLLQVMKGTAKHVCHDYKIKCNQKELVSNPAYNTMIASAYVADRMADFSGSYVLGLASYNAGPGRAREWIEEFGDPRSAKVDPLDWIERIPIEETRRYVVKVLSNIQIYRARLGEEETALRLTQDLNRAREVSEAPQRSRKGTDTTSSE